MIWESWRAFFNMGGYGLYVWGSVLLTAGLIIGEICSLAIRWNAGIRHLGHLHSEENDDENTV